MLVRVSAQSRQNVFCPQTLCMSTGDESSNRPLAALDCRLVQSFQQFLSSDTLIKAKTKSVKVLLERNISLYEVLLCICQ